MRNTIISIADPLWSAVLSRRLSMVIPVLYMAVLLILSAIPDDESLLERPHLWFFLLMGPTLMNFMHIPAYGLLAFFWRWSLASYVRSRTAGILAFFVTMGFGVLQEWYQSIIPGRYASLTDLVFDFIGAAAGLWCFNLMNARTQILQNAREPD